LIKDGEINQCAWLMPQLKAIFSVLLEEIIKKNEGLFFAEEKIANIVQIRINFFRINFFP